MVNSEKKRHPTDPGESSSDTTACTIEDAVSQNLDPTEQIRTGSDEDENRISALEQELSIARERIANISAIATTARETERMNKKPSHFSLRSFRRFVKAKAVKRGLEMGLIKQEGRLARWFYKNRPDRLYNRYRRSHLALGDQFETDIDNTRFVFVPPASSDLLTSVSKQSQRVLFVDAQLPTPGRDSGSADAINYLSWLSQAGFEVYFVSTSCLFNEEGERTTNRTGANIIKLPNPDEIERFLSLYGEKFEVFVLSRVNCGGVFFEACRRCNPRAKVIFNTVDLHHIREAREAKLQNNRSALFESERIRDREMYLARQSDITIVVSAMEQKLIEEGARGAQVALLPLSRHVPPSVEGFEGRKGIGFVGGFAHTPNIDAIDFFLKEVWPVVRTRDSDVKFEIVGPDLPNRIVRALPDQVVYKGQIDDLESWLASIRLTVAPLRYGAGAKGKVASSLANGVPVVGTKIAFEGMAIGSDISVIAESPMAMAQEIVALHGDRESWERRSTAAHAFAERHLSTAAGKLRFHSLVSELATAQPKILSYELAR